jgi:hypothetical protein
MTEKHLMGVVMEKGKKIGYPQSAGLKEKVG